jgi:REP element-mobilizing transposase RayT
MARPLRIEFADALYHVMSRGNDRRSIVRDDADRQRRCEWLARTVEVYRWRLHAFCLMTNHEHLFVETPEPNLSAGMQHLNGSYTSYYNLRHRRVGHLFQGRFKAHLIDNEGYYWSISRYIHLNPVRARLVQRPEEWPWSSYRGYHRASMQLPWATYNRVLREFGRDADEARRKYRQFVNEGLERKLDPPWASAAGGLILGGERFVEKIRGLLEGRPRDVSLPMVQALRPRPTLARIIEVVVAEFDVDPTTWSPGRRNEDAGRPIAAWLARRRFGYKTQEIAQALGYRSHGGTVAAIRRIEAACETLGRTLRKLEGQLAND